MKTFVLVFFPGCFLLVSLIVSKFAMVIGEQVEARVAEADQKHEEFGQIVEAVKRREEEEEEEVRLDCVVTSTRMFLHLISHSSSIRLLLRYTLQWSY